MQRGRPNAGWTRQRQDDRLSDGIGADAGKAKFGTWPTCPHTLTHPHTNAGTTMHENDLGCSWWLISEQARAVVVV